jgi:predicted Zn-dependent protease
MEPESERLGQPGLRSLDEISSSLQAALAGSPADETEFVWIESVRSRAESTGSGRIQRQRSSEVLVRVHERGRVGLHRTGAPAGSAQPAGSDLALAVREALAQARVHDALPGMPHLPADTSGIRSPRLRDEKIAGMDARLATDLLALAASRDADTRATLDWIDGRVVVANSRGVQRTAAPTAVTMEIESGRGEERKGFATASARFLGALDIAALADLARQRAAASDGEPAAADRPVALTPEATAALLGALTRAAFSAHAYRDGTSVLREHLGNQLFESRLSVTDNPTDPNGLPFPFDLEGTAKQPVDLLRHGTPRTPALDQRHAALLGMANTAHASGGDDAIPENLFIEAGGASAEDLLRAVDDGLWIGQLQGVQIYDLKRLQVRAVARGVRRIRAGLLNGGLAPQVWEISLLRGLAKLPAIGGEVVTVATPEHGGLFGGTNAPAIVLAHGGRLRPLG